MKEGFRFTFVGRKPFFNSSKPKRSADLWSAVLNDYFFAQKHQFKLRGKIKEKHEKTGRQNRLMMLK